MEISKGYRLLILGVALSINLGFLTDSNAEFESKKWQYYKEIKIKNAKIGRNYRVILDKDVYDESQVSLGDLRIITGEEKIIPYEIFIFNEESKTKNMVSKILENSVTEDNGNIIVLDLGESVQKNNKLSLDIADRNFGRKVMIEGSSDRKTWNTLVKNSYIYDFTFGGKRFPGGGQIKWQTAVDSKYMVDFSYDASSRDTIVTYNENRLRYLRITIFGTKDEEPLSVKDVNISSYYVIPAEETKYTAIIKETKTNEKEKQTEVIVDFGARNLPLHHLDIASSSKNYYRSIIIYGSNDLESWAYAGKGEVFDYDIENFKDSKKDIDFSETRFRYLKLIVLDRDNPPISIDSVTGTGFNRSVVFPYQAGDVLRLCYGSKSAKKPTYDYSRYVRKANIGKIEKLPLGGEFENTSYAPGPWTEERPYLLWVALLGIVVILLLLVASMMKKVK